MRFEFSETMSGEMDPSGGGVPVPFSFTVTASSESLLGYVFSRRLVLDGTARLGNVSAPARGSLAIRLPLGRRLLYTLQFTAPDGAAYDFEGVKDVRYLDFLRTITTLRGPLRRDGKEIGHATLRFSLWDIVPFVASLRVSGLPGLAFLDRLK